MPKAKKKKKDNAKRVSEKRIPAGTTKLLVNCSSLPTRIIDIFSRILLNVPDSAVDDAICEETDSVLDYLICKSQFPAADIAQNDTLSQQACIASITISLENSLIHLQQLMILLQWVELYGTDKSKHQIIRGLDTCTLSILSNWKYSNKLLSLYLGAKEDMGAERKLVSVALRWMSYTLGSMTSLCSLCCDYAQVGAQNCIQVLPVWAGILSNEHCDVFQWLSCGSNLGGVIEVVASAGVVLEFANKLYGFFRMFHDCAFTEYSYAAPCIKGMRDVFLNQTVSFMDELVVLGSMKRKRMPNLASMSTIGEYLQIDVQFSIIDIQMSLYFDILCRQNYGDDQSIWDDMLKLSLETEAAVKRYECICFLTTLYEKMDSFKNEKEMLQYLGSDCALLVEKEKQMKEVFTAEDVLDTQRCKLKAVIESHFVSRLLLNSGTMGTLAENATSRPNVEVTDIILDYLDNAFATLTKTSFVTLLLSKNLQYPLDLSLQIMHGMVSILVDSFPHSERVAAVCRLGRVLGLCARSIILFRNLMSAGGSASSDAVLYSVDITHLMLNFCLSVFEKTCPKEPGIRCQMQSYLQESCQKSQDIYALDLFMLIADFITDTMPPEVQAQCNVSPLRHNVTFGSEDILIGLLLGQYAAIYLLSGLLNLIIRDFPEKSNERTHMLSIISTKLQENSVFYLQDFSDNDSKRRIQGLLLLVKAQWATLIIDNYDDEANPTFKEISSPVMSFFRNFSYDVAPIHDIVTGEASNTSSETRSIMAELTKITQLSNYIALLDDVSCNIQPYIEFVSLNT